MDRADIAAQDQGELREALKDARIGSISFGNPDPAQRSASVTLTFVGADALARKNQLENALAAIRQQAQGADTGSDHP